MLLAMGTILSNKYWWFQKFPKQCPSRKKTTGQSQQTDVFGLKHSPHHRPMEPAEPFEAEIKVSTWVTWGMSRDAKKKTFFFIRKMIMNLWTQDDFTIGAVYLCHFRT
jgi:hypothetical protein